VRSQMTGVAMLGFMVLVCALHVGDSVQSGRPLHSLANGCKPLRRGWRSDAPIEVNGHNEIDEVGHWFNVFIARIEDIVRRVSNTQRRSAGGYRTGGNSPRDGEQLRSSSNRPNELPLP